MRRQVRRWLEAEVERMVQMREVDGLSWPAIDKAFKRAPGSSAAKYSVLREGRAPRGKPNDAATRVDVAPDLAEMRDARRMAQARLSLTGVLLGDPPPGYSALDRGKV